MGVQLSPIAPFESVLRNRIRSSFRNCGRKAWGCDSLYRHHFYRLVDYQLDRGPLTAEVPEQHRPGRPFYRSVVETGYTRVLETRARKGVWGQIPPLRP